VTSNSDGAEAALAATEKEEEGDEGRKAPETGAPPGGQPWTERGTAIRRAGTGDADRGNGGQRERELPKHKPLQTANSS
jgi:hypothetical protein